MSDPWRRFLCLLVLATAASSAWSSEQLVRVVIQTEAGEIEAEIDTIRAPVTAANFLKYVDAGLFNGGRFFRTVRLDNQPNDTTKIEVIQAAANIERKSEFFAAIPLERTSVTGLPHKDGTLSMARGAPDSATHSFSICINDQPSLDFGGARNKDGQGFAAFGRVVAGMDVVRKIQASAAQGQQLQPPIRIDRIARRLA